MTDKSCLFYNLNWLKFFTGAIQTMELTGIFSLAYAISMIFAGRFIDRVGTKKRVCMDNRNLVVWSLYPCFMRNSFKKWVGVETTNIDANVTDTNLIPIIASVSVVCFIVSRVVLVVGEAENFFAAIKATAEYFSQKRQSFYNRNLNLARLLDKLKIEYKSRLFNKGTATLDNMLREKYSR